MKFTDRHRRTPAGRILCLARNSGTDLTLEQTGELVDAIFTLNERTVPCYPSGAPALQQSRPEPASGLRDVTLSRLPGGRGGSYLISHRQQQFVCRHYLRGGLPGKLIHDRYVWTGIEHTRASRELALLELCQSFGLPASKPVAYGLEKRGATYRALLITHWIDAVGSLAETLATHALDDWQWQQIGMSIQQFHRAGIQHADLNAGNILLARTALWGSASDSASNSASNSATPPVMVIDFDRGRRNDPGKRAWQTRVLNRLQHSLNRLRDSGHIQHFNEQNWRMLLHGVELEQQSAPG